MNSKIPAPTTVPTKADVSNGIPVTFATESISVGIKVMEMITAMIAETNPAIYSLTSGIIYTFIENILQGIKTSLITKLYILVIHK
jgi:hypothetical protein